MKVEFINKIHEFDYVNHGNTHFLYYSNGCDVIDVVYHKTKIETK